MSKRLRTGIRWIDATGVNAYLLEYEGTITLVDAGTPFDAGRIGAAIEDIGRSLEDIDRILLTHYDLDHVGSIARLPIDAPIYIGRGDLGFLTGAKRPPWRSVKGVTQRVSGVMLSDVPEERIVPVDDGETIDGFEVYHTPGHTPGHTVYVHEARSVAFLGDLVVERSGSLRPTPWFLCYDEAENRRQIQRFEARSSPYEAAATGHGIPFRKGGSERLAALSETLRKR